MKNWLLALVSLASLPLMAQEVISTQGDSYVAGGGSIDFTIGEVVIMTGTNGANDLTQGFHQTNWNFVGLEDYEPNFEATVYPNPMENTLNIKTSEYDNVTYTLYDAAGRIVAQDYLSSTLTSIEVSAYAPGAYSLVLNNGNNKDKIKMFKLVKVY